MTDTNINVPKDVWNIITDKIPMRMPEYITFHDRSLDRNTTIKFTHIFRFTFSKKCIEITIQDGTIENKQIHKKYNPNMYELLFNHMDKYNIDDVKNNVWFDEDSDSE